MWLRSSITSFLLKIIEHIEYIENIEGYETAQNGQSEKSLVSAGATGFCLMLADGGVIGGSL